MDTPSRHSTETPKEAPANSLPTEGLACELPPGLLAHAERLRVALAATPIVIFNQDRDLRYTWIGNPALGLKAEEAIGRTDEDLLGSEAARPLTIIKRQVLETGRGERQDVNVVRAGQSGWYDLTVEPLRDTAGEICGITCVAVDISDRKRAETALQVSEAIRHQALHGAPDSVFAIDREYRLLFNNDLHQQILIASGGRPLHPGDDALSPAYPPEILAHWRALYDRALRGETFSEDNEWRDRAGNRRFFDNRFAPLRDPRGEICGALIVAREVTEHRLAEESLRESEQRFATIFRKSPVAIGISRLADGRFLDVNEAFVRLYGYAREELIGHTSTELGLWHSDNRPAAFKALHEQPGPQVVEMQARRKDGTIRSLQATIDRIQLGREDCFVGFLSDVTDRRQMEVELRKSEMRHRAVIEDQTEVLLRFTADGTLTFVNDVFCRFFGRSRGESIGSQWHPRAVAEDVPMIEAELRTLTPGNPVVTIENRVYAADGSVRWMQFVNRAFFDATGRLIETQAVGRDITERKRAEMALRQSEARFRTVFEHGSFGIALGDLGGRVTFANPAFHQILGYDEGELVGLSFQHFTLAEDLPAELPLIQELIAGNLNQYDIEKRYVRKDGRVVWIQLRGTALHDPDGRPVGGLAMVQDITARRQAEAALRESEELFRKVIENSRDGINLLDLKSGKYVLLSPAQVALTGFTRDEINQISAAETLERVHPDDRLISVEQQKKVAAGELPAVTSEYRWKVKSGNYRWFSDSRSVIRDEEGRAIALVGVTRDITERKRLEFERAEALARLAVIEEQERHRISRELHDQTAQRLVALSVELKNLETHLAAGKAPSRRLTSLRKTVDELQQQVRDIAWDLRTGELVQGGLDHALREYVEEWSERTEVAADFECRGFGGRRLPTLLESTLFRVAQEALANIAKHAHARRASVLLEEADGLVRLTVEDDGRGFEPEPAADTLEARQRLGLLGMKERVRLAGGTFLLESSPGAGTTVLVRLPLPKEDTP
ncbi:MAG: PAS domain S-box protein [Verrucomicrobia bacterium]|nr:PAS domain S-box protein [Verrucomicrobiota bacterium]